VSGLSGPSGPVQPSVPIEFPLKFISVNPRNCTYEFPRKCTSVNPRNCTYEFQRKCISVNPHKCFFSVKSKINFNACIQQYFTLALNRSYFLL